MCPLEFGLLFERFLSRNNTETPDIDFDFAQDRREEIIDYVTKKYSESNIAQIGTIGIMGVKSSIKDPGTTEYLRPRLFSRLLKLTSPPFLQYRKWRISFAPMNPIGYLGITIKGLRDPAPRTLDSTLSGPTDRRQDHFSVILTFRNKNGL